MREQHENEKMPQPAKYIRMKMADRSVSMRDMAKHFGITETAMHSRFRHNSWTFRQLFNTLDFLGVNVVFDDPEMDEAKIVTPDYSAFTFKSFNFDEGDDAIIG